MKKIVVYIKLMRLHHSVKNVLVLLPAFFAGTIFSRSGLVETIGAFFAFTLAASAIYVLNDICDVRKDRLHPEKCKR
ncbi:MAG: prenyltransferase, partial [Kiritimatiellia bacterium]